MSNILKGTIKIDAPGVEQKMKVLESQFERLQKIASLPGLSSKQLDRVNGLMDQTQKSITGLGKGFSAANPALQKFDSVSGASTQSLINLSRVAQDAPYGFIGIANNINPLLESFQRLQVQSKAAGVSLSSSLRNALVGPAGVGLAIGAVSSLLVVFGDDIEKAIGSLFRSANANKFLKQTLEDAAKSAGEQVVKLEVYRQKLNDLSLNESDRLKVAREYNKVADEGNRIDAKQISNLDLINEKIEAQNTLILKRAISTAAMARLTEESGKVIDKEVQLQQKLSALGFKDLDDYEKKQKEVLQKRIKNFQANPNAFKQESTSIRQGLDGIVTPAQLAAKSIQATDNELLNLIKDVKDGRADLQKFADSLKGLITIDGLTERTKTKTKSKVELPVSLRPKLDPVSGDLDSRIKEFNEALRKRIGDQLSGKQGKKSSALTVEEIDQLAKASENLFAQTVTIPNLINSEITPAFQNLFSEVLSGKNVFESLGKTVTGVLTKVAAQMAALAAVSGILSVLGISINKVSGFGNIFKYLFKGATGIPLATGMWQVPKDGLQATLHRDEMVVPARLARLIRSSYDVNSFSAGQFQPSFGSLSNSFAGGGSAPINSISGALSIPSFVRLEAQGDSLVGVLALTNKSQNLAF
ncbi:MAG: hypothetical protein ACO1OO_08590 [Flavisolibacter sp.]